jgi:hypothetical protein
MRIAVAGGAAFVASRLVTKLECLVMGHDDMMVRTPERLSLRCNHCDRETSGWTLARSHAAHEAKSAPLSLAAARPVLVGGGHCPSGQLILNDH